MRKSNSKKVRENRFQLIIEIIMIFILFFAFIPLLLMFFMSSKSTWEMYNDFFGLPNRIVWENYVVAFEYLAGNMINTLCMVGGATIITLLLSAVSGYVFATKRFIGKNFLYMAIMALMMIPPVLSLAANYRLIIDYGLLNTRAAIVFSWVSSGQILGIILCRNSIEGLPSDLFEAAKVEGCGDFKLLLNITVPLIKPILSTIAILKVVDYYNDFIWPMMVVESNNKQVITVVLQIFTTVQSSTNIGASYAGYVIATIPLLVLFLFTSRLYMEGLTAGAVKG